MSIRFYQIKELQTELSMPADFDTWQELVFSDPEDANTRIIKVRKMRFFDEINPNSVIAALLTYYENIASDMERSNNHTCKKGCCDCCTNDFDISITEYFMILNFLGIRYGDEYINEVCSKAKASYHARQCIFVDTTNGGCSIYEVRPLVCRKYGLYRCGMDCKKLDPESELLPHIPNTQIDTQVFYHPLIHKKIVIPLKPIVYWFGKSMEHGRILSDKTQNLFYASFQGDESDFARILV